MSVGVTKLFRAQTAALRRKRATRAGVTAMRKGLSLAQSVFAEDDKE